MAKILLTLLVDTTSIILPSSAYFEADGIRRGYTTDNADLLISRKYEEAEFNITDKKDPSPKKQENDEKKKLLLKSLSAFQEVKTDDSADCKQHYSKAKISWQ